MSLNIHPLCLKLYFFLEEEENLLFMLVIKCGGGFYVAIWKDNDVNVWVLVSWFNMCILRVTTNNIDFL